MSKISKDRFKEVIALSSLSVLQSTDQETLYDVHQLRTYGKNEEIFRSRTDGKRFFIVATGSFKLELGNGRSKILTAGQLIGEIAAFTNHERLGTLIASSEVAELLLFTRSDLEHRGLVPPLDTPTLLAVIFSHTVDYLHELLDNSTETLLERGEGEHIEFKEGANNPNILKSVAAFINTGGGILLIGVSDDAQLIGVQDYSVAAADKFDQDFRNLIREKIGSHALAFIRFSHGKYREKGIYRIDCDAADQPQFLKETKGIAGEAFYIRSGSTNQQLDFRAALHYIARRFPNELFNTSVSSDAKIS
jgi:hypothetical protein